MGNDSSEARWARRLPKAKLRRLYESDAVGALDEGLLEDVGLTLLLRCESILQVDEAVHGKVRCPRCQSRDQRSIIERSFRRGDPRDEVLTCAACGWSATWGQYQKSFQGKQLNSGGAGPSFRSYIERYRGARTPQEKMVAVDCLIHEWHYSLQARPGLPTRPVVPNLIEGKCGELIEFLDTLTLGGGASTERRETRNAWDRTLGTFRAWRRAGYPTTPD
jgi:hypothetical protein